MSDTIASTAATTAPATPAAISAEPTALASEAAPALTTTDVPGISSISGAAAPAAPAAPAADADEAPGPYTIVVDTTTPSSAQFKARIDGAKTANPDADHGLLDELHGALVWFESKLGL